MLPVFPRAKDGRVMQQGARTRVMTPVLTRARRPVLLPALLPAPRVKVMGGRVMQQGVKPPVLEPHAEERAQIRVAIPALEKPCVNRIPRNTFTFSFFNMHSPLMHYPKN